MLAKMFKQGTYELNRNKEVVDALNVFPVPDGDTGTNMSLTMNSAVEGLSKADFETVDEVAKSISKGSLMGARGNSGVILSQIFRGFAKGCKGKKELNSQELCLAFKDAADTAYSAVLKPVEGTILTVIREIAEKAIEYQEDSLDIVELFDLLNKRGEETLARTPEMLPVLKQADVVDAGGKGLLFILKGCEDVLKGHELSEEVLSKTASAQSPAQSFLRTEDIEFGYCTEFIIETNKTESEGLGLKTAIEKLGDSMVFVQDDDLIKVHIHTNNPGVALEEALKYGALKKIKIENMREQHSNIIEGAHASYEQENVSKIPYDETFGFIGVSMGEGFSDIFKDLGILGNIEGGQTMNPSTEDFMKMIEECPSAHIFIFPNNSNIIMAANQAKELSEKDIWVIPTKTMPQCITAMLEFDREASPADNYELMLESLSSVKTIQITYAVRNTTFNDMAIEKDDYLAVADGEIKDVGKNQSEVVLNAIEKTMTEDSEMLSIYYGADVSESDANDLAESISNKFPNLEVDVFYGGQPVYYFVMSLE